MQQKNAQFSRDSSTTDQSELSDRLAHTGINYEFREFNEEFRF
jgi:hypothetical protein